MGAQGFFQAPPYPVPLDGVAGFLGHSETDSWSFAIAAVQHFKQEKPAAAALTTSHGKKFGPLAQPLRYLGIPPARRHQSIPITLRPKSGRDPGASAGATGSNDTAATLGCHASAEAVTAFANEFGRLISTLHLFDYRGVRPFLILSLWNRSFFIRCQAQKIAPGPSARTCRAYREKQPSSQSKEPNATQMANRPNNKKVNPRHPALKRR